MKPVNKVDPLCIQTASSCITYTGPDVPCLNLCKGDTVSDVEYKAATLICSILDQLKISSYDLSCFKLKDCAPQDFPGLVQLLINHICALENIPGVIPGSTSGCPNCTVNMAPCLYFTDPKTGNQVTTMLLADYAVLLGNTLCSLISATGTQGAVLNNHGARISNLENKPAPTLNLPSIVPVCVSPAILTPIDQVLVSLENQFCALRSATGNPAQIYSSLTNMCNGLSNFTALSHAGVMSAIPGWVNNPANAADTITDLWITVCDMRAAVKNIQLSCCPTACAGLVISLTATLPSSSVMNLFLTGTIPAGLVQCVAGGTLFTITDQSGNSINVTVDIAASINNPGGYPVTLNGTPINTADNLTITATTCFKNNVSGSQCGSFVNYILVNTLSCPVITYIPGLTNISYSFPHPGGAKTYTLNLYDSSGTILLQNQVLNENAAVTVTGNFTGLVNGTQYKIQAVITTANKSVVTCAFSAVTTLPNPCPPVTGVVATITLN